MSTKFQGRAGSPIVSWKYLYLILIYLKLEWIVGGQSMDLYFIIIYRSIVNVIANDGIANVINVIDFDFILTLFFLFVY